MHLFALLIFLFSDVSSQTQNRSLKIQLQALDYLDPANRSSSSILVPYPRNGSTASIPAGYYIVGTLNNVDLRLQLDLESSAIYLYENDCEDCEASLLLKEQVQNWKGVVSTVVKYCQVSYRACEYFQDDRYTGYFSRQQLNLDDASLEKIATYTVQTRKQTLTRDLFSSPTTFGIFGLGRSDSDHKYQHSTKEELVSRHNLNSGDVGIHFHPRGSIFFEKKILVETLNNVSVHEFPIIRTEKISINLKGIQLLTSTNTDQSQEITDYSLDSEFLISSTCLGTYLPKNVFQKILKKLKSSLEHLQQTNSSLTSVLSDTETLSMYWTLPSTPHIPPLPAALSPLLKLSVSTVNPPAQFDLLAPFALANCTSLTKTTQNCTFVLTLAAASEQQPPTLGLHFLHKRYLHLSADTFRISSPLEPAALREAPTEDIEASGALLGLGLGVVLLLPVFYKGFQGCLKAVGI